MRVSAVDVAVQYSRSSDPQVRWNAASALSSLMGPAAVGRLLEMADPRVEPNAGVRRRAVAGLLEATEQQTVRARLLASLGQDRSPEVVREVMACVRNGESGIDPGEAAAALANIVTRASDGGASDDGLRLEALNVLGELATERVEAMDALAKVALDESNPLREKALELVRNNGAAREGRAVPALTPDGDQYVRLSRIRRLTGIIHPLVFPNWSTRLAMAVAARNAVKREGSGAPQLGLRVGAWMAGGIAAAVIGIAVGAFTPVELAQGEILEYVIIAGLLAAIVASVVPWNAQPASSAADRLAGAIVEIRSLVVFAIALGVILAFVAAFGLPHTGQFGESQPLMFAAIACVTIPAILVTRLGTLVAYGLRRPGRSHVGVQAVTGVSIGLATWGGGLVLLGVMGLVPAADLENMLVLGVPTCIALAVAFARIDGSVRDEAPGSARALRLPVAAALSLPALLTVGVLGFAYWQRPVPSRDVTPADPHQGAARQQHLVVRGANVKLNLPFAQEVSLKASTGNAEESEDLVLSLSALDGPTPIEASPSLEVRTHLSAGSYVVRVGGYGEDQEQLTMSRAVTHVRHHVLRALWTVVPTGSDDREPLDALISLEVVTNLRHVTPADVKHAARFRSGALEDPHLSVSATCDAKGKQEGSRERSTKYGVVLSDVEGLLAAGSIVRCVPMPQKETAGAPLLPTWDLVYGWSAGGRQLTIGVGEELRVLGGTPDRNVLKQARSYNRLQSAVRGERVVTPLATALARSVPDGDLIARLASAGQWPEQANLQGSYFLYTGAATSWVHPGSILRALDRRAAVGFELVDGRARSMRTKSGQPVVIPRRHDIALLGSTWDPLWLVQARAVQARFPARGSVGPSERREVQTGETPQPLSPKALANLQLVPTDPIMRSGEWIGTAKVDLAASEPPPIFDEYFLVTREEGFHEGDVGAGSIVRGQRWDNDGNPRFRVVYGWTRGGDSFYVDAYSLTYLGPRLTPLWKQLADAVHGNTSTKYRYRKMDNTAEEPDSPDVVGATREDGAG